MSLAELVRRDLPAYAGFDVVVVAASQGGLPVFRGILAALPADFPAAVIYSQHRPRDAGEVLHTLVGRSSALALGEIARGERLAAGTVYVTPPGWQLGVDADRRQAHMTEADETRAAQADPLLSSAAAAFGERALAVILSGRLRDGALGAVEIKRRGGRVLVQAPATAEYPSMPEHALATGCVDLALAPEQLGAALVALTMVPGARELFRVRLHPSAAI